MQAQVTTPETVVGAQVPEYTAWFNDFIGELRVHELTLVTGTADQDRVDFYDAVLSADFDKLSTMSRDMFVTHFVKKMTLEYFYDLKRREAKLQTLSMQISGNCIHIWAEISDDDVNTEKALILAEAKLNSTYYQKTGIYFDTMIVEMSDRFKMPQHFTSVFVDGKF